MSVNLKNLTLNQKLAVVIAVLGFLAVFAGNPYGGPRVTIASDELASIVHKEVDHVDPVELADWIVQGKYDYRLLDLRDEKSFETYHIPSAESAAIAGLGVYPIARNEKIILYSEGGIHSAQAWFLLKARDYKAVYILRGGLEEWKERVLFPTLPAGATDEKKAEFEKARSVAAFFGGAGRTAEGEEQAPQLAMPKLEMPSSPAVPGTAGKKKKEGC